MEAGPVAAGRTPGMPSGSSPGGRGVQPLPHQRLESRVMAAPIQGSGSESGLSGLSISAGRGCDGKPRVRVLGSINMVPGTAVQGIGFRV